MAQPAVVLFMFAVFVAIYAYLRERAGAKTGVRPPIRWRSLAGIVAVAALALSIGALTR